MQAFVVKSFCPLCIANLSVFPIVASILLTTKPFILPIDEIEITLAKFALIYIMVLPVWICIKALVKGKSFLEQEVRKAKRIKFDKSVFFHILSTQPKVDNTEWENDIIFGQKDSDFQILMVSNPFCRPCSQTHQILDSIVEKYSDSLKLVLRFPNNHESDSHKNRTISRLIQLYQRQSLDLSDHVSQNTVFKDWYAYQDESVFNKKYPETIPYIQVDQLMYQNDMWAKKNKITMTPLVYINGHKLPKQYSVNDLAVLIPSLID